MPVPTQWPKSRALILSSVSPRSQALPDAQLIHQDFRCLWTLFVGFCVLIGVIAIAPAASAVRQFGLGLVDRLRGQISLVVDQPTLRLLGWRHMGLLRALRQRGHASQTPLSTSAQDQWSARALPRALVNKSLEEKERLRRVQAELAQACVEESC